MGPFRLAVGGARAAQLPYGCSEPAHERVPFRRGLSSGDRDPAVRDDGAGRRAEHALGEPPEAPAGSRHAPQRGALGHDLGAEGGERKVEVDAGEMFHSPLAHRYPPAAPCLPWVGEYGGLTWQCPVVHHPPVRALLFDAGIEVTAGRRPDSAKGVCVLTDRDYRAVFEASPEAMLIVDREGVIRDLNPRAVAMFGWSREELEGSSVERLVPMASRNRKHRENYVNSPPSSPMGQAAPRCSEWVRVERLPASLMCRRSLW